MNKRNRMGPWTEPWGTPFSKGGTFFHVTFKHGKKSSGRKPLKKFPSHSAVDVAEFCGLLCQRLMTDPMQTNAVHWPESAAINLSLGLRKSQKTICTRLRMSFRNFYLGQNICMHKAKITMKYQRNTQYKNLILHESDQYQEHNLCYQNTMA